jgi:hypothetical protein
MAYFLLQKRPDGQSSWDDEEGRRYNFSSRLPHAKNLCKGDTVLFYRPLNSGTSVDGCIYALSEVLSVEISSGSDVNAELTGYKVLEPPVPIDKVGDPRRNAQHSFQPVYRQYYESVIALAAAMAANGNAS